MTRLALLVNIGLVFMAFLSSVVESKEFISKEQIIRTIVVNPQLPPDVSCAGVESENLTQMMEIFSWQIFSKFNKPVYYNKIRELNHDYFWSDLDSWRVKTSNMAPAWALMLNQSEIERAKPPFVRVNKHWQCDESCQKDPSFINMPHLNSEGVRDSSGNPVTTEVRLNQSWFYSTQKFTAENYKLFLENNSGNLFHLGSCGDQSNGDIYKVPTVMFNFGWKELSDVEDHNRYITMTLGNGSSKKKVYGLVAAHQMAKTLTNWMWVWSTFEHVNNFKGYSYKGRYVPPSFNSSEKKCKHFKECGSNLTPYKDISNSTKQLNNILAPAFEQTQSPLQYYRMLGVQFANIQELSAEQIIKLVSEDVGFAQTYKQCNESRKEKTRPSFVVSENGKYIFKTARFGKCFRVQTINTPKLFNPVLQGFLTNQEKRLSCMGCHANTSINVVRDSMKTKIYTDFSFAMELYGIPKIFLNQFKLIPNEAQLGENNE